MSANSKSRSRGFTVAEVLTVVVIMGIFTTFVVAIISPIANAPNKEQAKIDTLQAAAQGLYEIQRDLRMADVTGVYACTSAGGVATCTQPTGLTSTSILAIASPLASGQLYWSQSAGSVGKPAWQGVVVYWLSANGQNYNLERAYVSSSTLGTIGAGTLGTTFASMAATAAQDAQAAGGTTVASDVNSLSASVNTLSGVVGLSMTAQSHEGAGVNSTQYSSNTYARN